VPSRAIRAANVPEIMDLIHREMITMLNVGETTSLIVQLRAETMRMPQRRETRRRDLSAPRIRGAAVRSSVSA
jgi:regulator of PEP synthase PpsR (kinase-PPPase family)